ncbi:ABC transporter substrate-binding protein [Aureimonas populi]|uniref:ABC transporter substrate-binding protein n=1 Tax=Aureimonas populi TaxID=1701758 RepID=A0ABW5CNI1_9HYPH|nr:ABC transporter substrate-binding protein [Aureimonas populi]
MNAFKTTILAGFAALAMAGTALAQDVTIGRATEPSSIDPHFSRSANNQMTSSDIFDRLVMSDPQLQISPGLALSWTNLDPLTWEIKLREGVKFHDGSDFTAEDVVYSLERVKDIPNSPAPYTDMVASVEAYEVVDPLTLRVKTRTPAPALIEEIGRVFIVSRAAAEGKSIDDFNSGAAAIGTGPYKFERWTPGEQLVLARNEDYWGERPDFENVTLRFIANDAARVAAFLSGSVDLIDAVPPADLDRLQNTSGVNVESIDSGRLIYLGINQRPGAVPFFVDLSGQPLDPSPARDPRVRKALSKLIDRQLIIDRLINGSGTAAGQLVPEGIGGHVADLPADEADVEGAKALLAEAGYAEGFGITVHSSNDRFAGDGDIAQALGQMFARGGLTVNGVVTQPYNVYAANASKGEFGAFVFSLGTSTPDAAPNLSALLETYSQEAGTGSFNRMRYSNPEFDAALATALEDFDTQGRIDGLEAATRIAFEDMAIVPLFWQRVHWAAREGFGYTPNMSEYTTAAWTLSAN